MNKTIVAEKYHFTKFLDWVVGVVGLQNEKVITLQINQDTKKVIYNLNHPPSPLNDVFFIWYFRKKSIIIIVNYFLKVTCSHGILCIILGVSKKKSND